MKYLFIALLQSSLIFPLVENANILAIFPTVPKSHWPMFRNVIEAMGERGHLIDVVGGIPPGPGRENPKGLTYLSIPPIRDAIRKQFSIKDMRDFTVPHSIWFMLTVDGVHTCEKSFELDVMKNLRDSNKKYDLILIETFIWSCFFGFAHVFKAPVVSFTSSSDLPWGSRFMGNPDNPAYIPSYFQGLRPDESLVDRVLNTVSYLQTTIGYWWYIEKQNKLAKEFFGPDLPHLDDIMANISLFFINSHFSSHIARPMLPNVIEVGGLHLGTPKPLEKEIEDFIGTDKFIYFSLGSVAHSERFEYKTLKAIVETFAESNHKILWKANRTELSEIIDIPDNVMVKSWLPQMDILCRPNISFFITHAGLGGTQEAIHCGVPVLCMPLFADQYQNCRLMMDKGVANTVTIENLGKEEFSRVVAGLIEENRYKENAKILSQQFKDRPMTSLETALFWIDYVLRHKGAPQLKSRSIALNWYQYCLLDVIFILILTVLSILFSSYALLNFIVRKMKSFVSKRDQVSEENKSK